MDFLNPTPASARLFTGFTDPTTGVAAVVARRTYRLDDAGALRPSDEPWPIFSEPLETTAGVFPTDMTPAPAAHHGAAGSQGITIAGLLSIPCWKYSN